MQNWIIIVQQIIMKNRKHLSEIKFSCNLVATLKDFAYFTVKQYQTLGL